MKRKLYGIVALLLVLVLSISAFARDNETPLLSELSDEECVAFLQKYDVEIPTIYENELECVPFVRSVFERIESNPNATVVYRDASLLQFANDIKTAMYEFYEIEGVTTYITSTDSSIVEDSIVHVSWTNEYKDYNCYGYAIGKDIGCDPGFSTWVSGGNDINTYYYNDYANMPTISNWVKADLEYYGYTVNIISTTMPDTQVSYHTKLICVRKDLQRMPYIDMYGNTVYFHDYHFMRLDMDGLWYHKPGATSPLQYKYIPSNARVWVNEGYDGNEYFHHDAYTYDSEIYFLEYTTPHEWEYEYIASHRHKRVCTICGLIEASACDIVETYEGDHTHRSSCTLCGYVASSATACTWEYEYIGAIGDQNCHKCVCTECGYVKEEATACTYLGDMPCIHCGSDPHLTVMSQEKEELSE